MPVPAARTSWWPAITSTPASPSACGTVANYTLGCLPDGTPYVPPYTPFDTISLFGDVGKTNYDSLQIKAETKTPKYGLYALFAYTYSHTYDNGLSDGLGSLLSAPFSLFPTGRTWIGRLSQINLDNSFTGSVIYDLPFGRGKQFGSNWNNVTNTLLGGFQVTLIERISSGFPVPLIDSNNQSGSFFQNGGNGNNWNRPNRVAGCNTPTRTTAAAVDQPNLLCCAPRRPVRECGARPSHRA